MLLARVGGYLRVEISVTFFNIDSDNFSDRETVGGFQALDISVRNVCRLKRHEKAAAARSGRRRLW